MPKPRTKRSALRDEKKRKRSEEETDPSAKRPRNDDDIDLPDALPPPADNSPENPDESTAWEISTKLEDTAVKGRGYAMETYPDHDNNNEEEPYNEQPYDASGRSEREFLGILTDEEQEYFRSADEVLELNQFPTPADRRIFIANVFKEAKGKELKLASSQSCSRLMERLIMLAGIRQKKRLFEAFAGHFLSMVQHRFASHCCETLFLQSAPVVTLELGGQAEDAEKQEEEVEEEEQVELDEHGNKNEIASMEDMFLLTLDEFDGQLSYLLADKYASHTLRVLLIVLSGRPLSAAKTKSLLKSKKAEHITVPGASALLANNAELAAQPRPVPANFTLAVQKIIADLTASFDETGIRVLAKHPTGNPLLQLLLDLDLSLRPKGKKNKNETEEQTLLGRLLPGAPDTLAIPNSKAADFFNSMIYDPIGSRLIETIITHCPSKIFRALVTHMFDPRIHAYARNDTASYPAIRALERMSGKDLANAIDKILPTIPSLIDRHRYNVVKVLLERAYARNIKDRIEQIRNAIVSACSHDPKALLPTICHLKEDSKTSKNIQIVAKKETLERAAVHGAQLATAMLLVPGPPTKAVQASLSSLSSEDLLKLCTFSPAGAQLITTALEQPSLTPHFHKSLVASLLPHAVPLVQSPSAHKILLTLLEIPTKSDGRLLPFHLKEHYMAALGARENELRETWSGRTVWRAWKGDFWKRKRLDWVRWMKEVDGEEPEERAAKRAGAVVKGKKYMGKEEWERAKYERKMGKTTKPPRRQRAEN